MLHDGHAVPHTEGLRQVVGDEKYGLLHLLLQTDHLVLQFPADKRVQAAEGFVHEQDGRVHDQRPGDSHPLAHSSAEGGGVIFFPPLEADHIQGPEGLRSVGFFFLSPEFQAELHIVEDSPVGEKAVVLEDHGDVLPAEGHQFTL